MSEQISQLLKSIETQGVAFEEFKKSMAEQLAEAKKAGVDPILINRLEKIEKSMDTAIEQKAKLEVGFEAERKEREALELRINQLIAGGDQKANAKTVHIVDFAKQLANRRADLKKTPLPDGHVNEQFFDDYKRAQEKHFKYGTTELNDVEMKLLQVSIDPDGGYLVTPDLGGRIVKKVYETTPTRQIFSVNNTSKDKVEGIEDLGEGGCAYSGERNQSGNTTTPQIEKWEIPIASYDTEPKATSNLLDDADRDVEGWLADKVSNKFGRFESNEHLNGVGGATKIRGLFQYDTAVDSGSGVSWGSIGYIVTGVNGDFAASNPADKIFDLIGLLKDAYLANAAFLTRRSVVTKMRKFKDSQGNYLWQPSLVIGAPEMFGGYPIRRGEDVPGLSDNGFSMAFGDFKETYTIFDRQGFRVIRDHLTEKPYVKFWTSKRSGGGVINFESAKFLKFST
jgi:HK97 family phage major capsid protein